MKKILFLALTVIIYQVSTAQIKKSNWLVGGNTNFSYTKTVFPSPINLDQRTKVTEFNFQPNVGFFFLDKLAGGLRLGYSNFKYESIFGTSNNYSFNRTFSVGPFLRYYFLPNTKKINFLLEGSYIYGKTKGKSSSFNNNIPTQSNTFTSKTGRYSVSGGPVFFLKPNVGMELLVSYSNRRNIDDKNNSNIFLFGFGFQIHL